MRTLNPSSPSPFRQPQKRPSVSQNRYLGPVPRIRLLDRPGLGIAKGDALALSPVAIRPRHTPAAAQCARGIQVEPRAEGDAVLHRHDREAALQALSAVLSTMTPRNIHEGN